MKPSNYFALVKMLIERTEKREVNWHMVREDEFKVIFSSGAITIAKDWSTKNNFFFLTLRIYNINGDNIFEYPSDPNDKADPDFPELLYYGILENLYNLARSSYFKVEETIEDIFKEINNSTEIGSKEKPKGTDVSDLPF